MQHTPQAVSKKSSLTPRLRTSKWELISFFELENIKGFKQLKQKAWEFTEDKVGTCSLCKFSKIFVIYYVSGISGDFDY